MSGDVAGQPTVIIQQFLDGPLAFYVCLECHCAFGAPKTREEAEKEAAEHDAQYHHR